MEPVKRLMIMQKGFINILVLYLKRKRLSFEMT